MYMTTAHVQLCMLRWPRHFCTPLVCIHVHDTVAYSAYLALIVSMTVYLQARIWRLIGEMDQAKLKSTEPASTCADTKPEDLPR